MKRVMNRFLVITLMMGLLQSSIIVAKQCNDLIFALDPDKDETIDNKSFFVGFTLVQAVNEKAAPIVVSTNTVSNLCSFYKIWLQYKEDLKNGFSGDIREKYNDLLPIPNYAIIGSFDLFDKDWHCYMHKSESFILFVPKNYIIKRVPSTVLGIKAQMEACGFNITDLEKINNISPESLLQYIDSKKNKFYSGIINSVKSIFITNTSSLNIIDNIKSIFITKKPADITEISAWNFYIAGHGGSQEGAVAGSQKGAVAGSQKGAVAGSQKGAVAGSQKGAVAGLSFEDFINLMTFFNKGISTNFVYYETCFGGGQNQTFINEKLQQLNVDYIVAAAGSNEVVVVRAPVTNEDEKGKLTVASAINESSSKDKFITYFNLLESFFGDSKYVDKKDLSQEWKKDPIASIVKSVTDLYLLELNQPSVRIPAAGVFTVANVDKQVKILTHSIVKAYELENRTIDCSDKAITTIFVYPDYIKVPLKKLKGQAIVSPNSQSVANLNKLHIFEKIESDQFAVSDFLKLNATFFERTFIVKKFICQEMDPVENLIIMIRDGFKTSNGINVLVDVSIAFVKGNDWYDTQGYDNGFHVNLGGTLPAEKIYILDELKTYTQTKLPASYPDKVIDLFFNKTDSRRPKADGNTFMQDLVDAFEKIINKDFQVKKPGALKKVLLIQQLQGLEAATTPKAFSEQQAFLKEKNKSADQFTVILNRYKTDLERLRKEFDQAFSDKQFDNKEYTDIKNRINKINESLDIVLKGGQLPIKAVQLDKDIEQPAKPVEQPVKIEKQPAKPVEQPAKIQEQPVKPVDWSSYWDNLVINMLGL